MIQCWRGFVFKIAFGLIAINLADASRADDFSDVYGQCQKYLETREFDQAELLAKKLVTLAQTNYPGNQNLLVVALMNLASVYDSVRSTVADNYGLSRRTV